MIFPFLFAICFPALVQGADSLYDQQILQARQGQYAPFLSYLQQYQLRHALTPSQVADWLQVALWAGQDDEVVKVWRRYQVYMPLPARGTAAAAQALRAGPAPRRRCPVREAAYRPGSVARLSPLHRPDRPRVPPAASPPPEKGLRHAAAGTAEGN